MQGNGSEVARIREQITNEQMAGKLGLQGLAAGMGRHSFITKRQENIGALHEQLYDLVGDQAMAIVIEATDAVPDTLTRSDVLAVFRHEFPGGEERELLCNALQEAWQAVDLLQECCGDEYTPMDLKSLAAFPGVDLLRNHFGDEQAHKLIFAPSSPLIREFMPP